MEKTNNNKFIKLQQQEVNGAAVYTEIAKIVKKQSDKQTLLKIAGEELKHAAIFEKHTNLKLKPNKCIVTAHVVAAKILGYTFVIKLMENGENKVIEAYESLINEIPEMQQIIKEEEVHEEILLEMLDEERLHYIGDIVLGMNDALVELTGALAGYTLAMQNTNIIAMAGLITGISATMSMAASGYLSSREGDSKNALKSAAYTGFAYLITVALLIAPYLTLPKNAYLTALIIALLTAISIIAGFNYYISVAKSRPFKPNFLMMAGISMGVSIISFIVGIVVKNTLGIDL